ncbi:MAG: hypothetical protein FWE35_03860, partial [Streptosporangiales bacterium]|nr:hypothetical protein [Streptosporangiales bacterium]
TVTPLSWRNWNPETWQKKWRYRKRFPLPAQARGMRVFLDLEGAMTSVTPALNGYEFGRHAGGYLPARWELTDRLAAGENTLDLTLDSAFTINVPPNRPAPQNPRSIDFWQPGGVYRDARLRVVPQVFVDDVFARPENVLDDSARRLRVEYTLDAAVVPAGQVSVTVGLLDGSRTVASASAPVTLRRAGRATGAVTLSRLEGVTLWDTGNPKLYTTVVTLKVNGAPLHDYRVRTGFREARFTSRGFYLNGNRLKLIGLNRHQFYPFAGAALPARVQRRDAQILRDDLACNAVRCSHYPQSEDFLDACDELGLLVWDEIPGWGYLGDSAWREAAYADLRAMITRDRNHPSVVIWGAMPNEAGRHDTAYRRYNHLAHSLDPSRPTGGDATDRGPGFPFDVFARHDYTSRTGPDGLRQAALKHPGDSAGKPYLVTEAVGSRSGPALAYRRTDPQQLQQGLASAHAAVLNDAWSDPRYCGVISWSGFDYPSDAVSASVQGVKCTGVADLFRVPKPGAAIYRAQADPARRPVIEPAFYWHFGDSYPVTILSAAMVCSNLDRLEAYVGGKHFATLTPDTAAYPHLPHAPSFADFTAVDGAVRPDLRIDGYLGGRLAATRRFSSDTSRDRLAVDPDDTALVADGTDATRVEIRTADAYGNTRPYVPGDVTVTVTGPGILLGDSPLALADAGGAAAVWIRTLPGQAGTITVRVAHPALGTASASLRAAAPPGPEASAGGVTLSAARSGSSAAAVIEAAAAGTWYPSLAAAFSNRGITAAGDPSAGDLDGRGHTYSAEALAAEGLTPGAAVRTADGLEYTWPDVRPGQPDNALGSGQTVAVAGRPGATRLGLLAACTRFGGFGTLIIRYADGTSQYQQAYLNGWTNGAASEGPGMEFAVAAALASYNTPSGNLPAKAYVYAVTVPVDPGRRVTAVTLPNRSSTVTGAANAAHIFAVTTGTPHEYPSLAAAFNNTGISNDARRVAAGFDGLGNSYSREALAAAGLRAGARLTRDGLRFTWPGGPAGEPDNVLALGQTIRLSGTGTRLGFLGAASPGTRVGTGTVHYADGGASQYTFRLDNYFGRPGPSNRTAAVMPYLNSSGLFGRRLVTARVFAASVRIVPGREIRAVTLPPNGASPSSGEIEGLHLFAVTIGLARRSGRVRNRGADGPARCGGRRRRSSTR